MFEDANGLDGEQPRYELRLFVTGMTPRSSRAIRNAKRICEENLAGRYDLKVVDLYDQPLLAADAGIAATPTLVKSLPLPIRHMIGDLSDEQAVLRGMDIVPAL